MKMPQVKPEWILYGAAAGVVVLWWLSRKDRNADGRADGLFWGLGYDAGQIVPDFLGGAITGTYESVYSGLDKVTGTFGMGDSDCERYKREGNKAGIYWACWPKDWPIFN